MDSDPYLETHEKEDAFLRRVLETIWYGLDHSALVSVSDMPMQLLQSLHRQAVPERETQRAQEKTDDVALNFMNGFNTRVCICLYHAKVKQ